jgi:hypothetical protein
MLNLKFDPAEIPSAGLEADIVCAEFSRAEPSIPCRANDISNLARTQRAATVDHGLTGLMICVLPIASSPRHCAARSGIHIPAIGDRGCLRIICEPTPNGSANGTDPRT